MIRIDKSDLIEIDGEYYSLEELRAFITTSNELARKTERQTRFIKALKLDNSKLTVERNQLQTELDRIKSMSMLEFGNTYASDESLEADGKAFARSLLGKPMTHEEVVIEQAENCYVPYSGDDF